MNADNALPLPDDETGDYREVKWEVVAKTGGITPAEIIAGRLRAEGIPARAWQEGAGEALGLFVGLLGTGHVVVPEEFAAQARAILEEADAAWDEEVDDLEEE
jgi:hypothetical protein